jgi:hypothetical protein
MRALAFLLGAARAELALYLITPPLDRQRPSGDNGGSNGGSNSGSRFREPHGPGEP